MKSEIEIHDSTLAAIDFVGSDIIITFAPAYIHRSEGRPGVDDGTGWSLDVDLIIRDATVESSPSFLPSWLADGTLKVEGVFWDNGVPLPLEASGETLFEAVTVRNEKVVIRGAGVKAVAKGESRYLEEFHGKPER